MPPTVKKGKGRPKVELLGRTLGQSGLGSAWEQTQTILKKTTTQQNPNQTQRTLCDSTGYLYYIGNASERETEQDYQIDNECLSAPGQVTPPTLHYAQAAKVKTVKQRTNSYEH